MDFSQSSENNNLPIKRRVRNTYAINYKQSVEIAEEEAINNTLAFNKYQLTKKEL